MIVVLADDLSGAAELASAACARGLRAEVATAFDSSSTADVVAVDTDTRSLSPREAVWRVGEISASVVRSKVEWIYKKTDSVLRGHVRAEISAILGASGKSQAIFIPANPSRGRVIRSGEYFIDEQPLCETFFASDPAFPATSSDVRVLLEREPGAEVHLIGKGNLPVTNGICVPDVERESDLIRYADCASHTILCAGAVEFFNALLSKRASHARAIEQTPATCKGKITLLVCGSAAAWPIRFEGCKNLGIPIFPMPHELETETTNPTPVLRQWADAVAHALMRDRRSMIAIGGVPGDFHTEGVVLTRTLAKAVSRILELVSVERLLLEGGATAADVLRQMNWTCLQARPQFALGTAALEVESRPGLILAVKPGSYPWPPHVWPN